MEKGPFSLYDFMGYFFPGALALYLVILSQGNIADYFSKNFFVYTNKQFLYLPIYLILFYIIISYCLGHFLSFFSTLTIEKYTRIVYDDPSKILLNNKPSKPRFFLKLRKLVRVLLGGRFKYNLLTRIFYRFILLIIIWPLVFFDFFLVKYLRYKHSYLSIIDDPYKDLIKARINQVFKNIGYEDDVFKNSNNNFHKLLIHYNYEFTKYHGHKLMNYVSLYGFLRVITLISCLFFNYVFISLFSNYYYDFTIEGCYNLSMMGICLFSLATITFVFYLGYLKFYRRYSMENLMLVLIIDSNKSV